MDKQLTSVIEGVEPTSRATKLDILSIVSIAVLLVVIHVAVPESIQAKMAFSHQLSNPVTLLSGAYVHHGTEHLVGNVLSYLMAALFGYSVCIKADRRRWFRVTVVVFLLVLPIVVNLTSFVYVGQLAPGLTPTERGFSGVVAGFVGFDLVAGLMLLRQDYSQLQVTAVGAMLCAGVFGQFALIYELVSVQVVGGVFLVWVGGLLALWHLGSRPQHREDWKQLGRAGAVVLCVYLAVAVFVVLLFPAQPAGEGTFTNIYGHGAGLVWGGWLALWLVTVVGERSSFVPTRKIRDLVGM
jgi:hypothetical protein